MREWRRLSLQYDCGTVKQVLRGYITCFKVSLRQSNWWWPTVSRSNTSQAIQQCGYKLLWFIRSSLWKNSIKVKCYVAVFVCMAIKAVLLEIVSDMSMDAFFNAFKRFITRRGKPSEVFMDNGFIGANRELKDLTRLFEQENRHRIINIIRSDRIKWHFISPWAPHFSGSHRGSCKVL